MKQCRLCKEHTDYLLTLEINRGQFVNFLRFKMCQECNDKLMVLINKELNIKALDKQK